MKPHMAVVVSNDEYCKKK